MCRSRRVPHSGEVTSGDVRRVRLLGPVCGHWLGEAGRWCGSAEQVRPFIGGPRCRAHTPAALAGRPEPDELAARAAAARSNGSGPAPLARDRA